MKPYQYQVLRYRPDPVVEEFVNLGVVVFSPTDQTFDGRFLERSGRLSHFFPGINGRFVVSTVRQVQGELDRLRSVNGAEFDYRAIDSVDKLTALLVPPNDAALRFSEVKFTMDVELGAALDGLYERLVANYLHGDDREIHNDKEVWSKVYKRFFEERKLTQRLHVHTVRTNMDEIQFSHAVKNGAWHCLEPVNFNMRQKARVKEKVYKWAGKVAELQSADEELTIYFLSVMPKDAQLRAFIEKQLAGKKGKLLDVRIVDEHMAEETAHALAEVLDSH